VASLLKTINDLRLDDENRRPAIATAIASTKQPSRERRHRRSSATAHIGKPKTFQHAEAQDVASS
jgi:hypothetical protein